MDLLLSKLNNNFSKNQNIMQVGIIGAGKVGLSIASSLLSIGFLKWIAANSEKSVVRANKFLNGFNSILPAIDRIDSLPDMVLIAITDNQIKNADLALSTKFGENLSGKLICHTSGILTASALSECEKNGAIVASVHPYQTFFAPDANLLDGIGWGIEAAFPEKFASFVELLNGKPVILDRSEHTKALYHCSAVAASNFMTAMLGLAREIAMEAGLNPEQLIPQIAKQTLDNNILSLTSGEFPLTGPIARGDVETIKSHIQSLSENEPLLRAYCYAGLSGIEMAKSNNLIKKNTYLELIDLYQNSLLLTGKF